MLAKDQSGDLSLSVLLAATHEAVELAELYAVLAPQLAAVGGELLVGDGTQNSKRLTLIATILGFAIQSRAQTSVTSRLPSDP